MVDERADPLGHGDGHWSEATGLHEETDGVRRPSGCLSWIGRTTDSRRTPGEGRPATARAAGIVTGMLLSRVLYSTSVLGHIIGTDR